MTMNWILCVCSHRMIEWTKAKAGKSRQSDKQRPKQWQRASNNSYESHELSVPRCKWIEMRIWNETKMKRYQPLSKYMGKYQATRSYNIRFNLSAGAVGIAGTGTSTGTSTITGTGNVWEQAVRDDLFNIIYASIPTYNVLNVLYTRLHITVYAYTSFLYVWYMMRLS